MGVALACLAEAAAGAAGHTAAAGAAGHTAAAGGAGSIALPATPANPQYGVLEADPSYARMDYAAGVRLALVPIDWTKWEPSEGTFSASYRTQEITFVNQFRHQGFTVGINLSLNLPPAWALDSPNRQLVDQRGGQSGTLNFEFSSAVRTIAGAYVANVASALGSQITYYTLGASRTSEAIYPTTASNQWWAFDPYAQGRQSGRPAGVGANPLPGWVPGASTRQGIAVTSAQVQAWYGWYIGALANFIGWEKSLIESTGYKGYFEVNWPGTGANPWVYRYRLGTYLAATSHDTYGDLNDGAVYGVLLDDLPDLSGVVVDVTSVGDRSGTPPDNVCQAGDATVAYQTDPAVDSWSSVRVLSSLARQHNLPVIGENTGWNTSAQMTTDFSAAKACRLIGLQWAFDKLLYDGRFATLTDFSDHIHGTPQSNGAPTVTAIDTIAGPATPGTRIDVYGAGFATATAVAFGTTPAQSFTVTNASHIVAVTPTLAAGGHDIIVTNPLGKSSAIPAAVFTGYNPPVVTAVSPAAGRAEGGTTVTVHGINFTAASAVSFGPTPAQSFIIDSSTQLTAVSPAGTGTHNISVTNPGGTSRAGIADLYNWR